MASLVNKVVIITGASSGIGEATAILFAQRGAKVTLGGRDQSRLKAVMDRCIEASSGHSDRFMTIQGDITDSKVREEMVRKTVEKFGCLDIVVPNAGVYPSDATIDAPESTFDRIFDVNVKSVFYLIQQAVPHLEKSNGNIVSVSSIGSTTTYSPFVLYNMSKATVDHMTRCLSLDLGPRGIRVNAVNPSVISTNLFNELPTSFDEMAASERTKMPFGELGTAEDIAEAIAFLASDSAKFITGECLLVDGGRCRTGPKTAYIEQLKLKAKMK